MYMYNIKWKITKKRRKYNKIDRKKKQKQIYVYVYNGT